jgi:predicted ATPase
VVLDSLAEAMTFLDREKELALLVRALERLKEGEGKVVFVSGEAGIGKTRLVSEFRKHVVRSGVTFLTGTCYEQEQSTPYSPWVDILRTASRQGGSARDWMKKLHPRIIGEVGKLVPSVLSDAKEAGLGGWISGEVTSTSVMSVSAEQDRMRLFQSVSDFVFSLAESRKGLALFFDDVVWADEASLQLLHYVARRIEHEPIVLIATFRDSEVREEHPLQKILLDLHRQRISEQIAVMRLTHDYVSKLIENQLAATPAGKVAAPLIELIFKRTGGNPFFIEEMVHNLLERNDLVRIGDEWTINQELGQMEIPSSVRALVKQRVDLLEPKARDLLSIASIIGMDFDHDVLVEVSGIKEEDLIVLVEELLKGRLIREERVEHKVHYVFVDEQFREFLFDELSVIRKRRYHLLIAKAIEKVRREEIGNYLSALAYHYVEADDIPKALEYSRKAGEQALTLYAYFEATKHFTNALELTGSQDKENRLALISKLADISYRRSDRKAESYYLQAIELALELGKNDYAANIYSNLGLWYWIEGGDTKACIETCMKGLEVLKGMPMTYQESSICQSLARVHALTGSPSESLKWVDRAIVIAEKLGAKDILAQAYQTRSICTPIERKDDGIRDLDTALRFALESHNDDAACRAYLNLGTMLCEIKGDYRKGQELYQKGIDFARKVGFVSYQATLEGDNLYDCLFPLGEWGEAERLGNKYLVERKDFGERYLLSSKVCLASIALARGNFDRVRLLVDQILPEAERVGWHEFIASGRHLAGQLALEEGRVEEAKQDFQAGLNELKDAHASLQPLRIEMSCLLADVFLRRKDPEAAKMVLAEASMLSDALKEEWAESFVLAEEARIAEFEGRYEDAERVLQECAARWRKVHRPYVLALSLANISRVQKKLKRKEQEVKQSEQEASAIFAQLGITKSISESLAA